MGIYHYLATQHLVEFLFLKKNDFIGTSLEVLWLSLCASTAGATGSIPGWETDPNTWHAAKKKKKIPELNTNENTTYQLLKIIWEK